MDVFAFALASSNRTTSARAMEFAKFLREDSEYASWEMAVSGMLAIGKRMQLQSASCCVDSCVRRSDDRNCFGVRVL